MQVVILCGGMGTRLREETEYRPKPLAHVGDRPILWHIMKGYAHHGFTEFILPLGYKGEMIKDYFCNYELMNHDVTVELGKPDSLDFHNRHEKLDWRVTMVNTGEKTLKGGRIKRIERYVKHDTIMLTYGDGVSDIDINKLLAFHHDHGRMVTVTGVHALSRFGELSISGDQRVESFSEKPQSSDGGMISGGFFVLNRRVFEFLTEDENCDFEHGALEDLAASGELMAYRHDGFWACMDTLRDLEMLNKMWASGEAPWALWQK